MEKWSREQSRYWLLLSQEASIRFGKTKQQALVWSPRICVFLIAMTHIQSFIFLCCSPVCIGLPGRLRIKIGCMSRPHVAIVSDASLYRRPSRISLTTAFTSILISQNSYSNIIIIIQGDATAALVPVFTSAQSTAVRKALIIDTAYQVPRTQQPGTWCIIPPCCILSYQDRHREETLSRPRSICRAQELLQQTTRYCYYHCSSSSSAQLFTCLLYTSPSPRDLSTSRMPSSA